MILVDTSIWIDLLRAGDETLVLYLESGSALIHPWVIGEIALGNLANCDRTLGALGELPQAPIVDEADVLNLIGTQSLHGIGIGYVDAQLLASALTVPGTELWTRDRRLRIAAQRLRVDHEPIAG